ncbi:MAG: hypothetical protein R2761_22635 [Acidimicrobiales bacterium]
MSFLGLHDVFAWIMTLTNAAAGVWATAAHRIEQLRRRELWYLVIVAQVAVAIQVLLGVLVLQVDGLEVQQLHVVYGFVALATVGILYSYRQQIMQWQYLLYGGGCLFLMGMGIRGMFLGTP